MRRKRIQLIKASWICSHHFKEDNDLHPGIDKFLCKKLKSDEVAIPSIMFEFPEYLKPKPAKMRKSRRKTEVCIILIFLLQLTLSESLFIYRKLLEMVFCVSQECYDEPKSTPTVHLTLMFSITDKSIQTDESCLTDICHFFKENNKSIESASKKAKYKNVQYERTDENTQTKGFHGHKYTRYATD